MSGAKLEHSAWSFHTNTFVSEMSDLSANGMLSLAPGMGSGRGVITLPDNTQVRLSEWQEEYTPDGEDIAGWRYTASDGKKYLIIND